jgi:hypothetical protein
MRVLAEWRPCLRDKCTSEQVLEALRRLLLGGFVAALEESIDEPVLVPVRTPDYSPASLRRYWFETTASGRSLWEAWERQLDCK